MSDKEKLEKWKEMDFNEKIKYNGFSGFCNGVTFKESNLFTEQARAKSVRRTKKELERRKKIRDEKKH
jgi:hypothetical protein